MSNYRKETGGTGVVGSHPFDTPFARRSERTELLHVYGEWLAAKKPLYAKYYNVIAMLFMAVLIPYDFILFEDGFFFARFRILSILIISLNLLFLFRDQKHRTEPKGDALDLVLLTPGLLFNFLYSYFLYEAHGAPYRTVLIANFMVIFFTTFFVHRLWKEQYTLNVLSVLVLFFVGTLRPEIAADCILLAICHMSSSIAAFFFRREFVASMYAFVHQKR